MSRRVVFLLAIFTFLQFTLGFALSPPSVAQEWGFRVKPQGMDSQNRRVNIDPGYITPAKLVLATTKDYSHRIYLGKGIYAEVTLIYSQKKYRILDWTYPDFRQEKYLAYFEEIRVKGLEGSEG